ncbi:MAG: DUF1997 domain-containing protein [Cyanobacteria bacterium P01_A01_bin.123]
MISFAATQSIHLLVPSQPVPIQHYLRQPQRLVYALVDQKQVEPLSQEVFRLQMRPLKFMMIHVQPAVDMEIKVDSTGRVKLRAINCEIRGNGYINQRFSLSLQGELSPHMVAQKTYLKGRADLTVAVELPPIFRLTPKPLLEATGNGLLHSVLLTIKQRLVRQLLADYEAWIQSDDVNNLPIRFPRGRQSRTHAGLH